MLSKRGIIFDCYEWVRIRIHDLLILPATCFLRASGFVVLSSHHTLSSITSQRPYFSWSKCGEPDRLAKVERVFRHMTKSFEAGNMDAKPNLVSYVTLINAIVNSQDKNAAERAEEVLFDMYNQYCDGNKAVKPNTKVIFAAIDSWQKSGKIDAGERAERLLDWMIDIYKKDGDVSFLPNEYTFGSGK